MSEADRMVDALVDEMVTRGYLKREGEYLNIWMKPPDDEESIYRDFWGFLMDHKCWQRSRTGDQHEWNRGPHRNRARPA